jgi:hypothetical protein
MKARPSAVAGIIGLGRIQPPGSASSTARKRLEVLSWGTFTLLTGDPG